MHQKILKWIYIPVILTQLFACVYRDKKRPDLIEKYPDGKIKKRISYIDDTVYVEQMTFYPDGILKSQIHFFHGKLHGSYYEHKLDGININRDYIEGTLVKESKNGKIIFEMSQKELSNLKEKKK